MVSGTRTLLMTGLLLAISSAWAQTCAFSASTQRFEQRLSSANLQGGALLIGDRQGILLERYFGKHGPQSVLAIASGSELVSAVRIRQLIDQGMIDSAALVSIVLPQFSGEKAPMTVAQMFSNTAGYGDDSGDPLVFDRTITLAEAVDEIACCRPLPVGYTVGGQFSYGGVSMHIAGRVAEVASGLDWEAGWKSQLGAPLGITSIDWQAFGATSNYSTASNLRDAGRLMHLLANDGRSNNRRLLSPGAAERLLVNRAAGLPVAYAPPNVTPPVRYGLGAWIDGNGGAARPRLVHSLGAFGFMPWVDFERGVFGVSMIRGLGAIHSAAIPAYRDMFAAIEAEIDGGICGRVERFDELFVDDIEAR